MAKKSQNPADQHRRQQQLKELKKNKEKRIKERDDRVKETQTVGSIKAAIADVEKRNKHGNYNIADTRKLERLRKELKLVQQAQQEKPPVAPIKLEPQQPLTELDDPRKSVYYDAQFNPYGAPPPGRPRLYHRRGGGVTTNKDEAVVPGEEDAPLPQEHHYGRTVQSPTYYERQQQFQPTRNNYPPPPPPPPPLPPPPPPLPSEPSQQPFTVSQPPPPPPPPPPTDAIPSLPPPSESVQRLAKGKKRKLLAADIWASEQEIVYEKVHSGLDLEEGHVVVPKKETVPEMAGWYYLDDSNLVQGPFEFSQLHDWYQHGYFVPSTTKVRRCTAGEFTVMVNNRQWQNELKQFESSDLDEQTESIANDRRAVRREEAESNVQDRIAALREVGRPQELEAEEAEADSILARIDALKRERLQPERVLAEAASPERQVYVSSSQATDIENQARDYEDDEHEEEFKISFQDRINALKRERVVEQQQQFESDDDLQRTGKEDVRVGAIVTQGNNFASGVDLHSQSQASLPSNVKPVDYPDQSPSPSNYGPVATSTLAASSESVQYPLTDIDSQPFYPASYEDFVAPYAADLADVSYPIDSTEFDSGDGAGYPVIDAYPVTGIYQLPDDNVVASVGGDTGRKGESDQNFESDQQKNPPKQLQQVDKDVVSLLPTHLKRNRKTVKTKLVRKPQDVSTSSNQSTDQLDEFINEIENI